MAMEMAMTAANQPPINVCFPSSQQNSRCHITRRHPLHLHPGKFNLLSNGKLAQFPGNQGKAHEMRIQASVHTISAELGETSGKVNVSDVEPALPASGGNYLASNVEDAMPQLETYRRMEMDLTSTSESSGGLIGPESRAPSGSILSQSDWSSPDKSLDFNTAALDTPQAAVSTATESITGAATDSVADSAASTTTDSVASTVADSISSSRLKSAKEAYEALLEGSQDSNEPDSQIDAVSRASQSFGDGLSEISSTVAKTLAKVKESIESSLNGASSSVRSMYDDINGNVEESRRSFSFQGGNDVAPARANQQALVAEDNISDILWSPFQMGTPANNTLKLVVTTVEDITSKLLAEAGRLVAKGYVSTKEILPVDVQISLDTLEKKVGEASVPVQSILKQAYDIILDTEKSLGINPENPIIPVIFVVGGSIFLSILYWQSQYAGYSGDLTPTEALELLRKEGKILLVDIRPESLRENQGIPDLRRQARFKTASVEAFRVESSIEKMLKSTGDAEAAITAALIKNLKNVGRDTKIVIMDADGRQSKTIARALKRAGIKMPYRIDGGFKAWGADGLGVKQMGPDTPLTILKEETQAILDDVKPSPTALLATALGFFAGIYALIEWEKTLQFLGLICIAQVVYTRLNSYDTIEDAKEDLKLVLRPFAVAKQGIIWAAGQVEPNSNNNNTLLQLATSPSTSDVQDRVVQAAAKHGPLLLEPSSDQMPQASTPSSQTDESADTAQLSSDGSEAT